MTDAATAIQTRNLSKKYGNVTGLDDLNLTVPSGAIYGFLGPNGAGKTTTIKLILGFIKATQGSAAMFGVDCWKRGPAARSSIGYLVPSDNLYGEMTGQDLLDFGARLNGGQYPQRRALLDAFALADSDLKRGIRGYSRGMRQKLTLVAAMQHDPLLLILDEPTEGLDPLVRRAFEETMRGVQRRGRTVFMSSHELNEVERLCESVAIVRDGRLVAEESVAALKSRQMRRIEVAFRSHAPPNLESLPDVRFLSRQNGKVVMLVEQDINPLISLLSEYELHELLIVEPSLEEIFAQYYHVSDAPTAGQPPA